MNVPKVIRDWLAAGRTRRLLVIRAVREGWYVEVHDSGEVVSYVQAKTIPSGLAALAKVLPYQVSAPPGVAPAKAPGNLAPRKKAPKRKRWEQPAWTNSAIAAEVMEVARDPRVAKFHDDRAFIASVWDEATRQGRTKMTLAEFKKLLVKLHRASALRISALRITRADLVRAMDPKMVERSEAKYLNARFHFVAL